MRVLLVTVIKLCEEVQVLKEERKNVALFECPTKKKLI